LAREKAMLAPTMNRKEGKTASAKVKPFHAEWQKMA
jgi:hypothetical protein